MSVVNIDQAADGGASAATSTHLKPPVVAGKLGADESTRQRIIVLVGAQGPIKASQICAELGLSGPAVRRHLDVLVTDGIAATREGASKGRGRPAREYVLATHDTAVMPTKYDEFALVALAHVAQHGTAQEVQQIADQYVAGVEARIAPKVAAAGPELPAKVAALAEALSAEGHIASVRPVEGQPGSLQLCQGHCPLHNVASQYPEICSAEIASFTRLLGVPVSRLATLAHGDHVCTTHIGMPTVGVPSSLKSSS